MNDKDKWCEETNDEKKWKYVRIKISVNKRKWMEGWSGVSLEWTQAT